MTPWLVGFAIGWACGFTGATVYYRWNRLIRTSHEWYRDPVIRARYPEEAEKAFQEPDGW
jgi:hypothetical protein